MDQCQAPGMQLHAYVCISSRIALRAVQLQAAYRSTAVRSTLPSLSEEPIRLMLVLA